MIKVDKFKEPKPLVTYKQAFNASYKDLDHDVKERLKSSLLEEQGYICAYCMQRIKLNNMRIEHFKPQETHKRLQLDYKNMFAVCNGIVGENRESNEICDVAKKNQKLEKLNLLDHSIIDTICYKHGGEIYSSDNILDMDINEVLNLNHPILVNNRKMVRVKLYKQFHKLANNDKKPAQSKLEKLKNTYSNAEEKMPYVGVLLFYINKK